MLLHNIANLLAHTFHGNFAADSAAIVSFYAFVEDESQQIEHRAEALRYLATNAFGFDGEDAGIGIPDQELVDQYMQSR